jgi:hypothetical protein
MYTPQDHPTPTGSPSVHRETARFRDLRMMIGIAKYTPSAGGEVLEQPART